jgi:hypothetical protein
VSIRGVEAGLAIARNVPSRLKRMRQIRGRLDKLALWDERVSVDAETGLSIARIVVPSTLKRMREMREIREIRGRLDELALERNM